MHKLEDGLKDLQVELCYELRGVLALHGTWTFAGGPTFITPWHGRHHRQVQCDPIGRTMGLPMLLILGSYLADRSGERVGGPGRAGEANCNVASSCSNRGRST